MNDGLVLRTNVSVFVAARFEWRVSSQASSIDLDNAITVSLP